MTKFKVGDTVRYYSRQGMSSDPEGLILGQKYIVADYNKEDAMLLLEGFPDWDWFVQERFEIDNDDTLKESYSALLWLYRRLPRCYESPPHIEAAIKNLAKALGEDAQEFIDERKGMK